MNKATLAALLGTSNAFGTYHFKHANSSNPFQGKTLFANPHFTSEVKSAEQSYSKDAAKMRSTEHIGAANWIDSMSKISSVEPILLAARANGHLPMFVIYDLPNRDCDALASNGEIKCENSSCSQGLNTYKTQYVDPIVALFKKYSDVPVVAVIEPDSLPNLATNMGNPKCQQAEKAYKEGVSYTLQKIAQLGHVTSYLDAGHGGWLGWDNNLQKIAPIFKEVLNNAGGNSSIRGFVTNTANYQPLGSLNSTSDPCGLKNQYNFAIDEVHYINMLDKALIQHGMTGMGYITDTSRNGQTKERRDCSNWCNIKGAGLGMRPTTNTTFTGLSNLDALVWVKTPGESDGTSNQSAPRHDQMCNSADSFMPSPQAGEFSSAIYDMLVENAEPQLQKSELEGPIRFHSEEELRAHVAQTPLGKQAQKYVDLWANKELMADKQHQAKLANQQIIVEKQKEYNLTHVAPTLKEEDPWKIIEEKNAQFMQTVQQNKLKEAQAQAQYESKQAGFESMQKAENDQKIQQSKQAGFKSMQAAEHNFLQKKAETKFHSQLLQEHEDTMARARSEFFREQNKKNNLEDSLLTQHQDSMRRARDQFFREQNQVVSGPKSYSEQNQDKFTKAREEFFALERQSSKLAAQKLMEERSENMERGREQFFNQLSEGVQVIDLKAGRFEDSVLSQHQETMKKARDEFFREQNEVVGQEPESQIEEPKSYFEVNQDKFIKARENFFIEEKELSKGSLLHANQAKYILARENFFIEEAEAKVRAQEEARTAYKAEQYWAKGEHQGFWARDQFISNGPMDQVTSQDSLSVQKLITRDENRRRAMEYAKQH